MLIPKKAENFSFFASKSCEKKLASQPKVEKKFSFISDIWRIFKNCSLGNKINPCHVGNKNLLQTPTELFEETSDSSQYFGKILHLEYGYKGFYQYEWEKLSVKIYWSRKMGDQELIVIISKINNICNTA